MSGQMPADPAGRRSGRSCVRRWQNGIRWPEGTDPVGADQCVAAVVPGGRVAVLGFWVWLHGKIRLPKWLGGDAREVAVRLWTITWLTSVWVLLWGTISWANVLGGIGVALAIMILLPLPRVPVEGRLHPFVLLQIVARLMVDFCVSSAQVAWAAIRPANLRWARWCGCAWPSSPTWCSPWPSTT